MLSVAQGPHPSSRHPPQPGWGTSRFTWKSPVRRREETLKCLLPCSVGCKQSSDQGPLARPSLLTPKIPEAFPTLPSGIHSLSFPLPNYNVGGAGTQPGPQIPAPGGALEYRLLLVTGTPFGAGFLGGSPCPVLRSVPRCGGRRGGQVFWEPGVMER